MTLAQYMNSQFTLVQYADFVLRLIIACLCGAGIGYERTKRLKEAGIRTHVIVCCAAALTMIISKYAFVDLTDAAGNVFNGTRGADAARIAAQTVSGVSFLGAGVIFKHGSTVMGLTTAAGIWATAGIGLAIGSGMYIIGILATIIIAAAQFIMHRFTFGANSLSIGRLQFSAQDTDGFGELLSNYLDTHKIQMVKSDITRHSSGIINYDITVRADHSFTISQLTDFIESNGGVDSISYTTIN